MEQVHDSNTITFKTKPYLFSFSDHFGALLFAIFSFCNAIYNYFFTHDNQSTIAFSVATVISILISIVLYKKMPKQVTLSLSSGIQSDNTILTWDDIEKLNFTLTLGRNIQRVIHIHLKDGGKLKFYLRWFKEPHRFRLTLECFAKKNGITNSVEDRRGM